MNSPLIADSLIAGFSLEWNIAMDEPFRGMFFWGLDILIINIVKQATDTQKNYFQMSFLSFN